MVADNRNITEKIPPQNKADHPDNRTDYIVNLEF